MNQSELEELYEQTEHTSDLPPKNIFDDWFGHLDPKVKFVAGLIITYSVYQIIVEVLPIQTGALYIGTIVLFLYLIRRPSDAQVMGEQQCKNALLRKLKFKQIYTKEISQGDIKISLATVRRFLNGKPFKREIGFEVIPTNGQPEQWVCDFWSVYPGEIISLKKKTFGYDGTESPDIRYVLAPMKYREKMQNKMLSYGGGD